MGGHLSFHFLTVFYLVPSPVESRCGCPPALREGCDDLCCPIDDFWSFFVVVVVAGLVWFEVVCFDFVLSQTGSHYTILTVTM